MVDANNGVPALPVGSIERSIAHPTGPNGQSTAPAGFVAQWIAVKRDTYTKDGHNFPFFDPKDVGWISVAHPPLQPYSVDALTLIHPTKYCRDDGFIQHHWVPTASPRLRRAW